MPDPDRAMLLSLGFDAVLADYYWIQALYLVGSYTLQGADERGTVGDLIDALNDLIKK